MRVVLNGAERDVEEGVTVSGLVNSLGIDRRSVAVEVNLQIIKKADYEAHELHQGDTIEIVNFVGGG